jgi:hypothetical protein
MDTQQILEALDVSRPFPVAAIEAARNHRDSIVPVLIEEIERFASTGRSGVGEMTLFFAFHLLGEWREKSAYRALARFLQLPGEALEPSLGYSKTETAHRVMAAVFDGDPQPLHDVIRNKDADEFVRSRMLDALAMLTVSGDIPREATARFLRDCYDTLEPREDCYVWEGWQAAVSRLALADMKPLVEEAFKRGSIDPGWMAFKDFEEDLQHAIDHPGDNPLHPDGKLTPFGDTIVEVSHWHGFQPESSSKAASWSPLRLYDPPARNPFRDVGRNDPCPCGSGKKFKKCCLALGTETLMQRLSS